MASDRDSVRDVIIVEVALPAKQVLLFQALLQGEDGLAVSRCLDPEHKVQQLWTTPAMRDELYAWLDSLPVELDLHIVGEKLWAGERHGG